MDVIITEAQTRGTFQRNGGWREDDGIA
jgi:hypothetical protein